MRIAIAGPSGWPGDDAFTAHRRALDVLADPPSGVAGLPGLLALPARGPWAQPVGRTLAIAEAMPASLEPHGWRLGLAPDAAQRRAQRTLTSDVEAFSLAAAGWDGPVTLPVLGPFSLAALLWLPVGERVVRDDVALADLVDSLALGMARQLTAVRAACDLLGARGWSEGEGAGEGEGEGAAQIVLHEPLLADVLAGAVPTFSGMGRVRALAPDVVTSHLARLLAAWPTASVTVQVAADPGVIAAVAAARPRALQLDTTVLEARGWEAIAEQVEAGVEVRHAVVPHAGAVPGAPDPGMVARSVLGPWRATGLPTAAGELVLLPRHGVASLTPPVAEATLRATARCAVALAELLA